MLDDIRRHASLAAEDTEKYVKMLTKAAENGQSAETSSSKKEIDKSRKRISELEVLIQKLYEDKVFGVITEETYLLLSENMEKELAQLREKVTTLTESIAVKKEKTDGANEFAGLVKQYVDIQNLDSELVHTLIEKILIHQKEIVDGKAQIRVDIYYRFVGNTSGEENPVKFSKSK